MQHTIPVECDDCGRGATRHTISDTNDMGVMDRSVTYVECAACGRTIEDETELDNPVLQELQEGLRREADALREDYDVVRDDGGVLVVQDPSGKFQADIRSIYGDDIEHVLHELARQHVPTAEWTHATPITVVMRDTDVDVVECTECHSELGGCVDVGWMQYRDPELRAMLDNAIYPVLSCRVCGHDVDRSFQVEERLMESVDVEGPGDGQ